MMQDGIKLRKLNFGKVRKLLPLVAMLFLVMGTSATVASPPTVNDKDDLGIAMAALASPVWPKVYIVTYKPSLPVDATTDALKETYGLGETYRYYTALQGAALLVPDGKTVRALARDARVEQVVPDREVKLIPDREFKIAAKPGNPVQIDSQTVPTGLIRIGGLLNTNEGSGVTVAVLDTGIDLDHPDLAANIHPTLKKDCVRDSISRRNPANDGNGHGSHVAGTIAAVDNTFGSLGVGSQIKLVSVRVLNSQGSGTWTSVICGIDWVTSKSADIQVASMSLGGSGSDTDSALRSAIQASVNAGVTYTVAAGNSGADAANFVPAAYDAVITVSAYDASNGDIGFPSWSNYGKDVDIAAPGVSIFSTYKDGGYATLNGTSMATPHVAAAAALYLKNNPGALPAAVKTAIISVGENGYNGQDVPGGRHPEPLLNISNTPFT